VALVKNSICVREENSSRFDDEYARIPAKIVEYGCVRTKERGGRFCLRAADFEQQ